MDIITELGALALGSRLKRLSDSIMKEGLEIYNNSGIDFQPKWFPLYYLLSQTQSKGIMEIAEKLNITHPAVIQIAKEMEKKGWIESEKSENDARKRILKLSQKGLEQLPILQDLWQSLQTSIEEILQNSQNKLLPAIEEFEKAILNNQFKQFYYNTKKIKDMQTVEIIDYTPQYKEDFKRLNVEWISAYFTLEPYELGMLNDPEGSILSKGGKVFFAKKGDVIIGTCALLKKSDTTYELAKMGVSPQYQGFGAGKKLGLRVIEEAKKLGCTYLFLESNQKLIPALTMYKSLGFVEIPMGETPYARADYKAEMYL